MKSENMRSGVIFVGLLLLLGGVAGAFYFWSALQTLPATASGSVTLPRNRAWIGRINPTLGVSFIGIKMLCCAASVALGGALAGAAYLHGSKR